MSFLELLGMVMLVVMLFAIFIGIPISFTLLFLALIFGFIGLGVSVFDLAYLQTIGLMKQDEFVAVPMFVLMGYICDQAGLMERLFKAFRDLFAPVRGALYLVVIGTATATLPERTRRRSQTRRGSCASVSSGPKPSTTCRCGQIGRTRSAIAHSIAPQL